MKPAFWKTDWFIGLVVTALFGTLAAMKLLGGLDWVAYDIGMRFSPQRTVNSNVAVINIDRDSLQEFGGWPWPRDILAEANDNLNKLRPKVVAYALPFHYHQSSRGAEYLKSVRQQVAEKGIASREMLRLLDKANTQLNTDGLFAESLKQAGRLVLAGDFDLRADAQTSPVSEKISMQNVLGKPDNQSWLKWFQANVPQVNNISLPVDAFLERADMVGLFRMMPGREQNIRAVPLVYQHAQSYLPSFPLAVAARTLSLHTKNIKTHIGKELTLGYEKVSTDKHLNVYPYYYSANSASKAAIPVYSMKDVLNNKLTKRQVQNKTIIIGLSSDEHAARLLTPRGEMTPALATAHIVSAFLNHDFYTQPAWAQSFMLLILGLVGLYLMFVLPRFRMGTGLALTALFLVVIFNIHFIVMIAKAMWLPIMVPALSLIFGHMVLGTKHLIEDKVGQVRVELSESNLLLGQSFQAQGQLDPAFEKYRKCIMTEDVCDRLYSLGLDFERKRQFNKAAGVFSHIKSHNKDFRDVGERHDRNREMSDMVVLGGGGGGGSNANGTLVLSNPGLQKPMLGRYQIDKELGRGAMGMVYLGHDPKIGRTVAIKTMSLGNEFDGERLDDVKKRFFREAETAGRLNHPNIVTIYDVGEDQDLSYIAMDYLKGKDLLAYSKPDSLLSAEEVMRIMSKVAEALDYAHQQNVVHRDIKPANIIYDKDNGTVKVTDFGVACLTDASKTKTGTILGSPSYMSPEQLAGKKVDGRSDLFSLGVTLYQLLAGELPFVGESLASLMFKITNDKHPDIRMFRPDLPSCISKIINKALHKEIERRFQTGERMADALLRCMERINR